MKPLIKNKPIFTTNASSTFLKIKRLLFLQNFGRDKHVIHECWIIRTLCRRHVYHVQNLVKVIKYFLLYITLWLLRLLSLSGNINSFCALNFTVNTTFNISLSTFCLHTIQACAATKLMGRVMKSFSKEFYGALGYIFCWKDLLLGALT